MKIFNNALVIALIVNISSARSENESGKINFVGAIYSGDCAVNIEVDNAENSTNIVTLDAIDIAALGVSGSAAKTFNIVIDQCAGKSTFEIALTGDWITDTGVVQAVDLNSATVVDNLGFQVKGAIQGSGSSTPEEVNWKNASLTQTLTTELTDNNAKYIFPFSVDYYYNGATEDKKATVGTVKASVNYLISYQ